MGLFFALCLIGLPAAAVLYEFWKTNGSFRTVLSANSGDPPPSASA